MISTTANVPLLSSGSVDVTLSTHSRARMTKSSVHSPKSTFEFHPTKAPFFGSSISVQLCQSRGWGVVAESNERVYLVSLPINPLASLIVMILVLSTAPSISNAHLKPCSLRPCSSPFSSTITIEHPGGDPAGTGTNDRVDNCNDILWSVSPRDANSLTARARAGKELLG